MTLRSSPCRSEHDFWAELDAEDKRQAEALRAFYRAHPSERPAWFRSYGQMAKWVGIWLLAVAALAALIVGWMAL